MAENEVEITVRVDAQGAITVLNKVGEEVTQLKGKTEQGAQGFSKFQASLVSLNQGIQLAGAAVRFVTGTFQNFIAILNRGDEVDDVTQAFKRLTDQSEILSDTMLGNLKKATESTLSDFELMAAANKAMTAGIDPQIFDDVAAAAKKYADTVGIETTESLDRFIQALSRGSEFQLKQLGLLKDGKISLEQFDAALADSGSTSNTVAEAVAKFTSSIKNTIDAFALLLTKSPAILAMFDSFSRYLDTFNEKLMPWFVWWIERASASMTLFSNIGNAIASGSLTKLSTVWEDTVMDIVKAEIAMKKVGDTGKKLSPILMDNKQDLEKFAKEAERVATEIGKLNNPVLPTFIDDMQDFIQMMVDGKTSTEAFNRLVRDMQEIWIKTGMSAEQASAKIGEAFQVYETRKTETQKALDEVVKAEEEAAQRTQEIWENTAANIGNIALDELAPDLGDSFGGQIGEELGRGISEQFNLGPIGDLVLSAAGGFVGDFIDGMFGKDSAGTKARKAADKFFADAFDANRLGVIINDELVKVSDLVFSGNTLFGGNANFETGGVASFFESLPAVAREGFAGVGIAFEEMLGVGEDISGQLAAVFANNIGGSLNNLQLLVQATGVSFEDLHGHVVEAFLDGKLSILETQSALSGIANIAQQGIPGAIGAVSEAFNNLKAAGTKGGRALVDALQDIGAESAELGLNTLPEVQQHLAKTGQFSAQEIQQVFTALQSNGINSVEALQNATVEQLLPALAQLETVEFPFAQAAKDINELIDQVNNIPKNITSNITFNVKTNIDSTSQDVLDQTGVNVPQTSAASYSPGNASA